VSIAIKAINTTNYIAWKKLCSLTEWGEAKLIRFIANQLRAIISVITQNSQVSMIMAIANNIFLYTTQLHFALVIILYILLCKLCYIYIYIYTYIYYSSKWSAVCRRAGWAVRQITWSVGAGLLARCRHWPTFNIYLLKCWARIAGYTSGCSVGVTAGAQTGAMSVCYQYPWG